MEVCQACGSIYFNYVSCPICKPKPKHLQQRQNNYMGFNAVVTPDDLKRGDLVTPGWYDVEIDSYEEKEASTDKSTNCIFHFKIFSGPSKGVSPTAFFNEKALGFGKNLWKALEFPFDPEKGYALSSDLFKQTVGSKLSIYIKRGKSNKGNEFNEVADYRKLAA